MSVNNEEKEDKWYRMKPETKDSLKLRFTLVRITLLTLILYGAYTSVYPLSEFILKSDLSDELKTWINQMLPIIIISITAIAVAFLAPIKQVRERVGQAPSVASQVQPMPTTPQAPAPVTPAPITPSPS
jgi:hypothetical protein